MRPKGWLSETDEERAAQLTTKVSDLWKAGPELQNLTPHDPGHFERVEHNVRRLIPRNLWGSLRDVERFLLTCAAWTHDVAMHPDAHQKGGRQLNPHQIRSCHVEESANWVIRERRRLGLSFAETSIIAEIDRHHSRKNHISGCSIRRTCAGQVVRPQLLAAYLRLADAMEVAHERVDDWELSRFLFLQQAVTEGGDLILFHWIKSFVASGIIASIESETIVVEFQAPIKGLLHLFATEPIPELESYEGFRTCGQMPFIEAERSSGFRLVTQYVLDELRNELESIERILSLGGISSFHFVEPAESVILLSGEEEPAWSYGLIRVVNYMRVAYSPNSTGTAKAALTAIENAISLIRETAQNPCSDVTARDGEAQGAQSKVKTAPIPREIMKEVFPQLRESLQARLDVRSCHNELRRITNFVVRLAARMIEYRGDDYVYWLDQLTNYGRKMDALIDREGQAMQDLCENFWSVATQKLKRQIGDGRLTVLLFGNSSTVARLSQLEGVTERKWLGDRAAT